MNAAGVKHFLQGGGRHARTRYTQTVSSETLENHSDSTALIVYTNLKQEEEHGCSLQEVDRSMELGLGGRLKGKRGTARGGSSLICPYVDQCLAACYLV